MGLAQLDSEHDGGEAALHHAQVVARVRRDRLLRLRQRVGDHEGGLRRQVHLLRPGRQVIKTARGG